MSEPVQQRDPHPTPSADPDVAPVTGHVDESAEAAVAVTGPDGQHPAAAAIATWSAPDPAAERAVPLSPRTQEPTRLASIWIATVASYLAVAVVGAATLWVYWDAVDRFAQASWLMGQFETEPGSLGRVLLAVAVTAITLVVGTLSAITGYCAYDGRRWTRWFGLVAFGASLLALMLNPLAWAVPVLAGLAAAALWLPPSGRYFAAWQAVRRHDPVFSPPPEQVAYGPLPRYR